MTRIITIMLAMAVFAAAIFTVAIYGVGIDNQYTRKFNATVPILPAAMLNGKLLMLVDVEKRLALYENAVQFQSDVKGLEIKTQRSEILGSLVREAMIADLASKRNVQLAEGELGEYYRHVISNFSGRFEDVFGVSEEEFKVEIIRPDLYEKKLRARIYAEAGDSKEYGRARKIRELLDNGLGFSDAVWSYSEDENSKYIGGDLGFKSAAEHGPWLVRGALKLQGTSTSDVIVSPEGYHIIRVASRDSTAQPEEMQIQHIFIRGFDFEEYLDIQRKNYRIYTFIK